MTNFPPPECSQILYRAVLQKDWIKADGTLHWRTFIRIQNDDDGVSLFYTPEKAKGELKKPFAGMMSVHVGRVRDVVDGDIRLDVIQDAEDHAYIDGIPYEYGCDPTEKQRRRDSMTAVCRRLAASAARLMWRNPVSK